MAVSVAACPPLSAIVPYIVPYCTAADLQALQLCCREIAAVVAPLAGSFTRCVVSTARVSTTCVAPRIAASTLRALEIKFDACGARSSAQACECAACLLLLPDADAARAVHGWHVATSTMLDAWFNPVLHSAAPRLHTLVLQHVPLRLAATTAAVCTQLRELTLQTDALTCPHVADAMGRLPHLHSVRLHGVLPLAVATALFHGLAAPPHRHLHKLTLEPALWNALLADATDAAPGGGRVFCATAAALSRVSVTRVTARARCPLSAADVRAGRTRAAPLLAHAAYGLARVAAAHPTVQRVSIHGSPRGGAPAWLYALACGFAAGNEVADAAASPISALKLVGGGWETTPRALGTEDDRAGVAGVASGLLHIAHALPYVHTLQMVRVAMSSTVATALTACMTAGGSSTRSRPHNASATCSGWLVSGAAALRASSLPTAAPGGGGGSRHGMLPLPPASLATCACPRWGAALTTLVLCSNHFVSGRAVQGFIAALPARCMRVLECTGTTALALCDTGVGAVARTLCTWPHLVRVRLHAGGGDSGVAAWAAGMTHHATLAHVELVLRGMSDACLPSLMHMCTHLPALATVIVPRHNPGGSMLVGMSDSSVNALRSAAPCVSVRTL